MTKINFLPVNSVNWEAYDVDLDLVFDITKIDENFYIGWVELASEVKPFPFEFMVFNAPLEFAIKKMMELRAQVWEELEGKPPHS